MDFSLLHHRIDRIKAVFSRSQLFQKDASNSTPNTETLKLIKGFALLLLAVLFAWIAQAQTSNSVRLATLETEWPEREAWEGILKQRGCVRFQPNDWSSTLKYHPDPFSKETMIWETEDQSLLLLLQSPYQQDRDEPELWRCATGQLTGTKAKWHKIGKGHSGVNQLAKRTVVPIKKTSSYIDPKEIRY